MKNKSGSEDLVVVVDKVPLAAPGASGIKKKGWRSDWTRWRRTLGHKGSMSIWSLPESVRSKTIN